MEQSPGMIAQTAKEEKMNPYGLSMSVLHTFLDTARAYLDLARKQGTMAMPRIERRNVSRLQAATKPTLLEIECRKNASVWNSPNPPLPPCCWPLPAAAPSLTDV
jgi:hypothetical protein